MWTPLTRDERRLQALLGLLAILFVIAAGVYALGPFVGPFQPFVRRLPFVAFSVVKVTTLALVCLYAAGDVRHRRGLAWVAVGGHVVSIAAMLVLLLFADTARPVMLGSRTAAIGIVLGAAIALDLAITALLALFIARAGASRRGVPNETRATEPLASDRTAKITLLALGGLFGIGALLYELGALLPQTQLAFRELPFVTNSVVKVATLGLVAFYIAADIRTRLGLANILVLGHAVSVAIQLLYWLAAGAEAPMVIGATSVAVRQVLLGGAVLDSVIAVGLALVVRAAFRARLQPSFLSVTEYRTLMALADVLLRGDHEPVSDREIAANVDRYLSQIRARRRWTQRAVLVAMYLHPVLTLKPPLSEMDPEVRLAYLKRYFYGDLGWMPAFYLRLVQTMIRLCKQLTYVGYYSDEKSFASVGYVPYEKRPGAKAPVTSAHPLKVRVPKDLSDGELLVETDYCIVGSGAAGAVLAYELACKHSPQATVTILERGRYVEPRQFDADEVGMIGKLYEDGAFQQTRDFGFTILQGSCVGGSTVVNNAVSFPTPLEVVARWNDPARWDAGLDAAGLAASNRHLESWLPIVKQPAATLNPSGRLYMDGIAALHYPAGELSADIVNANIAGCVGCGYCNIGCRYSADEGSGRSAKLSMLETVLPRAQRESNGRVQIYAECEVTRIASRGNGERRQVTEVVAKMTDGRTLRIKARKVIVSAGTIASSYILMQSGIGRGLPVGEGLSFNMGAPMTADFGRTLDAYKGLQISHFGLPRAGRGWVFETWFNPPVAQALNMPGWFERHYDNMRRFPQLMAVGVLVGTESTGRVERALTGGPDVVYQPSREDRLKLADGLIELGRILFAAGARRVMVNAWNDYEFMSPQTLGQLIPIALDARELTLGTGHPQGGNAISRHPERGVVGPDFRVHGYENLYVCDASVFPSSLTVNPQQTVMALAHYAAPRIA